MRYRRRPISVRQAFPFFLPVYAWLALQGCACMMETPETVLLNPDWYHSRMKPAVADWVLLWLQKQNVGKSGLSDIMIRSYILGGANVASASGDAERERLEALHAAVSDEAVSDSQRKMINLSHDWLQHFFPHCLQKIDRVTFGTLNKTDYERIAKVDPNMPDTRRYLAIPFEGKDVPSKSSEFAHPDVGLGSSSLQDARCINAARLTGRGACVCRSQLA